MAQQDSSQTKLYHIESNYFSAGLVINDKGLVVNCAPIIKYMMGWSEKRVMDYIRVKGWWFSDGS